MEYTRLFIWAEGDDDVRFFNSIIKPIFEERYDLVEVRPYAKIKPEKVSNFLKSIKAMSGDYIFVRDFNAAPCVTSTKQKIQDHYENVYEDRIIVVIKEIESWYLAGLDEAISRKLKLSSFNTTDSISKEQFNDLVHHKFDSRIDFMLEILKHFSIQTAKQTNSSFRYFCEKYNL
jgi:hypothetical protein